MKRRNVLLGLLLSASAFASPSHAQAPKSRALPDSIANLGPLVDRLSADAGYFDTDNLISNEQGYQRVLNAMGRLGVRGGAYIGVGPDQNYTYIAHVRPHIAFIVDIRHDNMLEHLLFKALFAAASNRAEYLALWTGRAVPQDLRSYDSRSVAALVARIDSAPPTASSAAHAKAVMRRHLQRSGITLSAQDVATIERFHDAFIADGLSLQFTTAGRAARSYYPTLRQLILERDAIGRQASYLATEQDFQFIKTLHRRNLIVPVTGDLAGEKTLPGIGRYLGEHGERVSALYASNVEDYLIRDGRFATYVNGVRRLPADTNAVIIRSYFDGGYRHPESTAGYYATQLLQRMDSFISDSSLAGLQSYRELVMRHFVPLTKR